MGTPAQGVIQQLPGVHATTPVRGTFATTSVQIRAILGRLPQTPAQDESHPPYPESGDHMGRCLRVDTPPAVSTGRWTPQKRAGTAIKALSRPSRTGSPDRSKPLPATNARFSGCAWSSDSRRRRPRLYWDTRLPWCESCSTGRWTNYAEFWIWAQKVETDQADSASGKGGTDRDRVARGDITGAATLLRRGADHIEP